jgi:putative ABC transport system permease protein
MLHKLAWYQLISEKRRLVAALAGIAFAVLLQLMQFGFRDALFTSATTLHSHLRGELVIVSTQYEYLLATGSVTRRRFQQAQAVPGVAAVAPVYVGGAAFKNIETLDDRRILIVAFDPDDDVIDEPTVVAGLDRIRIPDVVLFDERGRLDFGPVAERVRAGGDLKAQLGGRQVTVGGLFTLGVSFAANGHLVMSDATFRTLTGRPEGTCELGVVRLAPGTDVASAQAAIEAQLPDDVRVLTQQQFIDVERAFWDKSSPIGFIFLLGTLIGLLVGAVIVYQILYTDVSDHLGEYATLKAMGYSDRHFYYVVLEEALILSVAGFPFGFASALLLYAVARNVTRLPITMTTSRALLVFVLTVAMCAVAGMMATRKLRAADPAEVF